ncbi:MAG: PH domain-containing protein, partial [Patescibacteria group bacterium]|nr:PH domain-containing protein [Patescibacteria group bacterium]
RWIYRKLIGSAFGSALASLIAVWILFAQGKNGGPSLAEIISFGSFGDGLALFIGLALLLFIYQIIYLNVWKKNYRFEFTPEFVYMRRGFIGMSETHVPYGTIQDVIVRQGVLDRVFGLYDVVIQNAASVVAAPRRGRGGGAVAIGSRGPTIPGQPLEPATKLADFVKSVALSKNSGITGL